VGHGHSNSFDRMVRVVGLFLNGQNLISVWVCCVEDGPCSLVVCEATVELKDSGA